MTQQSYRDLLSAIKNRRLSLGFSQEYMAMKLGLSQNSYSKVELGITTISVERLVVICGLLDLTASSLLPGNLGGQIDFSKLFYSDSTPMWIFDAGSLRFLEVNDAAIDTYGFTKKEFLDMTIKDIRHADQEQLLEEALQQTGDFKFKKQYYHQFADGKLQKVRIERFVTKCGINPAIMIKAIQCVN